MDAEGKSLEEQFKIFEHNSPCQIFLNNEAVNQQRLDLRFRQGAAAAFPNLLSHSTFVSNNLQEVHVKHM